MIKLVDVFYTKLIETYESCQREPDIIQKVYDSLWCNIVSKTGNRCKSRATQGSTCARHSKPKCQFILQKGKNRGTQCSRYAGESGYCAAHQRLNLPSELTLVNRSEIIVNGAAIQTIMDNEAIAMQIIDEPVNVQPDNVIESDIAQTVDVQLDNVVEPDVVQTVDESVDVQSDVNNRVESVEESDVQDEVNKPIQLKSHEKDPRYCENRVRHAPFPIVPRIPEGCGIRLTKGARAGQLCGKPIKQNQRCGIHKDLPLDDLYNPLQYIPKTEWIKGDFWTDLTTNYDWRALASRIQTVGRTVSETLRDNDDVIDTNEITPKSRPKICWYGTLVTDQWVEVCNEPIDDTGSHYCKKHKKHEKGFHHACLDPQDNFWWVGRPIPDRSCGMWHFTRLNLYAWLTKNGFVAVGKLWYGAFPEQLTLCKVSRDKSYSLLPESSCLSVDAYGGHDFETEEDETKFKRRYKFDNNVLEGEDEASYILRCHNNGLLYKIIPQDYLLHNYDLFSLDSLPGKGFVSFEQMLRDRPALYIKYWRVWNEQILRAREFILCKGYTVPELHAKFGLLTPIFWQRFEEEAFRYGLFNVIVPPPTLEEVSEENFNPFLYCERWVEQFGAPEDKIQPHFPPMYILYPFPNKEYQLKYKKMYESTVKSIALRCRKLVQHYHSSVKTETPYTWLQWLKFGNGDNLFSSSSLEVPPKLRERIGFDTFPVKF